MTAGPFTPTTEQQDVIKHQGDAFVSACPGSGKTRVMVERARLLLKGSQPSRGVAFLSFTNAAVSELEVRLRADGLLPSPTFPHFIGTFDSFLWLFFIAPFGAPGCAGPAQLIPDKDKVLIRPYDTAREIPLKCFGRLTGQLIRKEAERLGFDPDDSPSRMKAYETAARKRWAQYLERGELNFDDVRDITKDRLQDTALAQHLGVALSARFNELIVDEAQDCNFADLEIIDWLRKAGIAVKVICDPHQSVYAFRGGVTEQLLTFSLKFKAADRLTLSGNFRSSAHICKAIVALRSKDARAVVDQALGKYRDEPTPVLVLSYSGTAVPASIGLQFQGLVSSLKADFAECPVLAATRSSGCNAIGQPPQSSSAKMTLRLAKAVTDFHFSFEAGNQRKALEALHRIVLELEGHLKEASYHQHLKAQGLDSFQWRPRILQLASELRYDPTVYPTTEDWLKRAKALLAPSLPAEGKSISQRLCRTLELANVLRIAPMTCPPAKTIHSVKGMQFPAVCVVMTSQSAKGILDYLETGSPADSAEEARKIYVAASRAERLLAIAIPKSQAKRLETLVRSMGAGVTLVQL